MAHIKLKTKRKIASKSFAPHKLKSKSSAKKRFSFTATGKVIATQANKQHNMMKHSRRQRSLQAGTVILARHVARVIKRFFNICTKKS